MRIAPVVATVVLGLALLPAGANGATCADHPTQASAQEAKDTRDSDGDGIYCEDNPCPCSTSSGGGGGGGGDDTPVKPSCSKPAGVVKLRFSSTAHRHIRAHMRQAIRAGWPRILVLNRPGADRRRDKLLRGYDTKPRYDRDEYPPAVGRGRGPGLSKGRDPRGWKAHVAYVGSNENRSHGASLGNQLRPYCNGTRFRYTFG